MAMRVESCCDIMVGDGMSNDPKKMLEMMTMMMMMTMPRMMMMVISKSKESE